MSLRLNSAHISSAEKNCKMERKKQKQTIINKSKLLPVERSGEEATRLESQVDSAADFELLIPLLKSLDTPSPSVVFFILTTFYTVENVK